MKNIFPINFMLLATLIFVISSCDFEYPLPDAGSIPDETPPEAGFDYAVSESDYLLYNFVNLSSSATDYVWDFGDGNSSTELEPSNLYTSEGTYTVSLTATDKLNVSNTVTQTVEVKETISTFEPTVFEAGFEDNDLPDGTGDGRDSWRNSDLGSIMQITSSPVNSGEQAAKFPSDPTDARVAYQLVTVEKNTDYNLKFFYTMKTSPVGSLTVDLLAGHVTDVAEIAGKTIESVTVNDQTSADDYIETTLGFNSGDNTEVAIYITNEGVECRLDDVSITQQ